MSSADRSDKSSGKKKMSNGTKSLIAIIVVFSLIGIWAKLYSDGEKCQSDIDKVNYVIKLGGGIDTKGATWQQLGIDGCADLSKSPKGFVTQEIQP